MMKLKKMHATAKNCKDFDPKSQVQFAFGRLINCQSLDDAKSLAKCSKIVLKSWTATPDV